MEEAEGVTVSLRTPDVLAKYREVVDGLGSVGLWTKQWALAQYVGLVLTAMCYAVAKKAAQARQYAVLRVLETFVEHRFDLFPATESDMQLPRQRVEKLAVAGCEAECESWIDVLEYMQLRNWQRKGKEYPGHAERIDLLRSRIAAAFSVQFANEVDDGPEGFCAD